MALSSSPAVPTNTVYSCLAAVAQVSRVARCRLSTSCRVPAPAPAGSPAAPPPPAAPPTSHMRQRSGQTAVTVMPPTTGQPRL